MSGVGKTCLLYQYTHNEYKPDYMVTIGVEFSSKIMKIDPNTTIKLQIWDTVEFKYIFLLKNHFRRVKNPSAPLLNPFIVKQVEFS